MRVWQVPLVAFVLWLAAAAGAPAQDARELMELVRLDPRIKLNIHYARDDNFLGFPVYKQARAFLQKPSAQALKRVHDRLREKGYGIVVFDGYRPWSVTRLMWDRTPPEKRQYVADPSKGSRHNRGCAVDLSLIDLETGEEVAMPSPYDDFTERAHSNYPGGTEESRRLRDLLRSEMEKEGFTVYPYEWWHFDYNDWKTHPILDLPFSEIGK